MITFLMLTIGCIDSTITPSKDAAGIDPQPLLEIDRDSIEYGEVEWAVLKQESFTVRNVGDENSMLYVDRIFVDDGPGFRIVDDVSEFTLAYGEERTFTVSFSPLVPEVHRGLIIVESDNGSGDVEDSQVGTVLIDGMGIMAEAQITPDPYDFGNVMLGCERTGQVMVSNVGNAPLRVDNLELPSGVPWTIDGTLTFPFEIAAGAQHPVSLRFIPPEDGGPASYTSELTLTSNEPIGTRIAEQMGAGNIPGRHEEHFVMPEDPPVDIVIYIDPSRSMDDDHEALALNFADFIVDLERLSKDWQLILVNTDSGCSLTGVLTPSTPMYEQTFIDALSLTQPDDNVYQEAGFTVVDRALEQTGAGQCNEGFVREGAYLHTIFISDEGEQSVLVSGNPARNHDYYYQKFLQAKEGRADRFRSSAVAGDMPVGCESDTNTAEEGDGYIEMAALADGVWLSICSNWSNDLDLLAETTFTQAKFVLTEGNPDPATLEVEVNGVASVNWTYDQPTRTIIFNDDHKPTTGDDIRVRYDDLTVCD